MLFDRRMLWFPLALLALSCLDRAQLDLVPDGSAGADPELVRRAAVLRAEDRRLADDDLRAALQDPVAEVRAAAVRAAGRIGDPALTEALVAAGSDPEPGVRAEAAYALALVGGPDVASWLRTLAGDGDARVRAAAAQGMGLQNDPSTSDELVALIGDPDPAVAKAAATATARFADASFAVDALIEVASEGRVDVVLSGLAALARVASRTGPGSLAPRRAARKFLLEVTGARDARMRLLAARGLALPNGSEELDRMDALSRDPDPLVRAATVRSLSFAGAPPVPYHSAALQDDDDRVVVAGLLGYGRLRGPDTLEMLARYIVSDSPNWRRALAITSTGAINAGRAAVMANGLSKDPSPILRWASAGLVTRQTDALSREIAARLRGDEHPMVRQASMPSMGAAAELLSELVGDGFETADVAERRGIAQAAGIRIGREDAVGEEVADAFQVLLRLWDGSDAPEPTVRIAILEAATEGGTRSEVRELLERGLDAEDYFVRRTAASFLHQRFGDERVPAGAASDRPLEHYLEVLRWAQAPQAAIVTVQRPGFRAGRFTVRLNTNSAPLSSWNFARLAEEGFYDGMAFGRLIPNSRVWAGDPDGDRLGGPGYTIRDEIGPADWEAGTIAMVSGGADGAGSQWFVTLGPQPHLAGRFTVLGKVVQNLPGVVMRLLPTDRIVSIRIYEGNGSEPLAPAR